MPIDPSKLKNIAFSSAFNYQEVKLKGSVLYTIAPYEFNKLVSIPHNLGYKPYFRLYFSLPGSGRIFSMIAGPGSYGLVGDYQVDGYNSTETHVNFQLSNYGGGSGAGRVYYRIYENNI